MALSHTKLEITNNYGNLFLCPGLFGHPYIRFATLDVNSEKKKTNAV